MGSVRFELTIDGYLRIKQFKPNYFSSPTINHYLSPSESVHIVVYFILINIIRWSPSPYLVRPQPQVYKIYYIILYYIIFTQNAQCKI